MWDVEKNGKGYGEENTCEEGTSLIREDSADASTYTAAAPPIRHSADDRRRMMERLLVEQAELWERLANS
jgi:hypothetical protein